ncbi:hypothetical protein [Breoghania sp. L-A4]|uniref:hypothetical protein n=1 Tax=Breoghania sp. L-A4 TaxID=2304600 RepID=UPI000E35B8C4|nr:hypothetical protein [Breoghania sp. L-A4]AXS41309.1 hypothetical protein D1F64_16370 [Breoghania sp. L-A4]
MNLAPLPQSGQVLVPAETPVSESIGLKPMELRPRSEIFEPDPEPTSSASVEPPAPRATSQPRRLEPREKIPRYILGPQNLVIPNPDYPGN